MARMRFVWLTLSARSMTSICTLVKKAAPRYDNHNDKKIKKMGCIIYSRKINASFDIHLETGIRIIFLALARFHWWKDDILLFSIHERLPDLPCFQLRNFYIL